MNITDKIKQIVFTCTDNEYKNYLKSNNILIIKEDVLPIVINKLYDDNQKSIKNKIRTDLKLELKEDYPSAIVENAIFDIFQDRQFNLNRIIEEIRFIQKNNLTTVMVPIINNSLNMNIGIQDNFIVINSSQSDVIRQYKFIYAINDVILESIPNENKINAIKREIKDKETVLLYLYYRK